MLFDFLIKLISHCKLSASTLIIIYMRASAYEWTNDDKKWRFKRLRRPLLFTSNWIQNGFGRIHFLVNRLTATFCLTLASIASMPNIWIFHLALGFALATNGTLKILCMLVVVAVVALNNDSESRNHVGRTRTHAQTPFKWPWCSRSSALIQFYA